MRKHNCLFRFIVSFLLGLSFVFSSLPLNAIGNDAAIASDNMLLSTDDIGLLAFDFSDDFIEEVSKISEEDYIENMRHEYAEAILNSCKISEYVDVDDFYETKPMFRLKSLESLNTYVVQNEDGSNTMYVMEENVKYINANGEIREKDIKLKESQEGYFVDDSDVEIYLPFESSGGIIVNSTFGHVKIIPQNIQSKEGYLDENTVIYPDAFGVGTKLEYTPLLSGLKEDIILESYPDYNKYSFIIEADGMILRKENNLYYLISNENSDLRFRFGQILVYDADGKFTVGELDIKEESDGVYSLLVTVSYDFLYNPQTKYPVTIDPSMNVETGSDSSKIIDASVFQNTPNLNAGTWQYDNIGYTDSTYGLSRSVFKLSGLLNSPVYGNLTAEMITNVTLSVKEATGSSSKAVNLYALYDSSSWTETSVTWNNYGLPDTDVDYGGNIGGGTWSNFNITNLVKAWKNGSYNGNGSMVFIMSGTENSPCRALCATEHSGTGNRPYLSMTYQANVVTSTYTLYVNENYMIPFVCSVIPSGNYNYSWSINNENIATCISINSSSTQILGLRAGSTELVLTVRDSSFNTVGSAIIIVFVLKPDGVYKITNATSFPLECDGIISDNMPAKLSSCTYLSTAPVTDRIKVMWRIKHIIYNYYSIRPLYKPDMCLGSDLNNHVISRSSGISDAWNDLENDEKWQISWVDNSYYAIIQNVTAKRLTLRSNSQEDEHAVFARVDSENNSRCKWSFEQVSQVPEGIYLFDINTEEVCSDAVKYVAPEETRTLDSLGLIPVSYSAGDLSQTFSWSSSATSNATVLTDGSVTGILPGVTTVTVSKMINGISCSLSYSLNVTEVANGTYFIKNKETNKYIDIENHTMSNGTQINQWDFDGGQTQRWIFTHLGDGYYSIKSANSELNYYLGVQNDSTSGDIPVVLRTGSLTNGMKWKISLTESGAYKITAKTGEANNMVMAVGWYAMNLNGIDIEQRDYFDNESYKDEWVLERMLPTNGYELDYNPSVWAGVPSENCNCYGYAINNQTFPVVNQIWRMQNPGRYAGISLDKTALTESSIYNAVLNDFTNYGSDFNRSLIFQRIDRYAICPPETYKIASVVGYSSNNEMDYHWYRQDSDGLWSHKCGLSSVERIDAEGKLIIDPQIANRDYSDNGVNYSIFLGYYAVTPWNNMYHN